MKQLKQRRWAPGLALTLAVAACAPAVTTPAAGQAPEPSAPADPDPARLAAELQRATLPAGPRQIAFGWTLDEAGAGFRGRGVGRYVAPGRFRIDLFGPRGETYLAAALVDGEARVPAAVEERFRLPSPALLWAAAGVFVPPPAARLVSARTDDGVLTLRYETGSEGVLEFRARGTALVSVRRLRGGGIQESVDLERAADGTVRQARYRDWPAFRTLTLSLESTSDVPAFSDDIWSPPGTQR